MEDASAFGSLQKRSPIGWLRERDIDLLLCSELHVDGPLRRHLALGWQKARLEFEGAWVSHNDLDGESDLVVAFRNEAQILILLIENKIAADFQPDQEVRYQARAQRWEAVAENVRVRTALFAPMEYFDRPGGEIFDLRFSYEEIMNALDESSDPRSVFLSDTLREGIAAYRRGYTAVPNESVSDVWTAIWGLAGSETPMLQMKKPNLKPGGSSFIYFRQASGFSATDVRQATVVLKAAHGNADLQFRSTGTADLELAVTNLLENDMTVTKAAKSASIRISVPKIDFGQPAEDQIEEIKECLLQAERLRKFFVKHQPLALLADNH